MAELGRSAAIPDQLTTQLLSNNVVVFSNIAFFSQTGGPNNGGIGLTAANCTFENPCGPTDFSQTGVNTLNGLLPNTTMYFNGGNYPALDTTGTFPIALNANQSVQSRTADYSEVATDNSRSIFNGAFNLNGNNTLENIIVLPTPAVANNFGVGALSTMNNVITGSQIGSATNLFSTGIRLLNNAQAVVNNTDVEASFNAVALFNSSVSIQNSVLGAFGGVSGIAGISGSGAVVDVQDTTITVSAISSVASGITAAGSSNVTANRVHIEVTDGGTSLALALNNNGSSSTQASNSFLSVTGGPNVAITNLVDGAQITASTCFINGTSVICP